MDRMYAPWRMAYLKGEERTREEIPSPTGCIFCDYPRPLGAAPTSESPRAWDRQRYVLTTREHAFAILNRFPYGNGHVMVVPRVHLARVDHLDEAVFSEVHKLLHEVVAAVFDAYAPHGMNIGMNIGEAGGAGIAPHVHYHVLPRWRGDVNFMPALADTKVISEGLEDTWERLAVRLRRPADDR